MIAFTFDYPCPGEPSARLVTIPPEKLVVFDDSVSPPRLVWRAMSTVRLATIVPECPPFYQDSLGIRECSTGRIIMEGPR